MPGWSPTRREDRTGTDAWSPQTNGVVTTIKAAFPVPGPVDVIEPGVTGVLHAGLAPIPAALRATLAVSRSSVIIERMTARLTARRLTD